MVKGAVLRGAFIFSLLAGHSSVGVRVEIHLVVRVSKGALVPVVAVFHAGRGARVLAPTRDRQIRELTVALEKGSPVLANLVSMPTIVKSLADILVPFSLGVY